jgi:glyoxylase-like metal-dependent hydrolase (beta-lactamase superfamily II)
MLGDVHQLADNLWLIEGEWPDDLEKDPDIANAVLYRAGDRLYLMDTGVGSKMRTGIERALAEAGPARSFTLLHSHAHVDHVCNNDLIHTVKAAEKHHYFSEPGQVMLDYNRYFSDIFYQLSEYYDPFAGFRANRVRWRLIRLVRDTLALFVGQQQALRIMMPIGLKKWEPVYLSRETMEFYETLPRQKIRIGDVTWTSWMMGDDDVWVLEDRGHSPDHVLFYVPEHHFLHAGDMPGETFPLWPDSDGQAHEQSLRKCLAMTRAGDVQLLTDGHHHQIYRGSDEIEPFLERFITVREHFQQALANIMEKGDGLTVPQVYARVQTCGDDPAVRWHLDAEYPHSPLCLQQTIALYLLDMGYEVKGPWRRKRFLRPGSAQLGVAQGAMR